MAVDLQRYLAFLKWCVHHNQQIDIAFRAGISACIRAEKDDLLRLELFHNLFHHLINGFLWNTFALVNCWNFYDCHLDSIIQPLFILLKQMGRRPTSAVPSSHFPLLTFYNFGNRLTTFAAVAGRSMTPP